VGPSFGVVLYGPAWESAAWPFGVDPGSHGRACPASVFGWFSRYRLARSLRVQSVPVVGATPGKYVLATLGGVQRFVGAGRAAADVWAGSHMMSQLALRVVQEFEGLGWDVIIPTSAGEDGSQGVSNRIWARAANGDLAKELKHLGAGLGGFVGDGTRLLGAKDAPLGFPVFTWVIVEDADYLQAWRTANAELRARKRSASFDQYRNRGGGHGLRVCSICAEREVDLEKTRAVRTRRGEELCDLCAEKRHYRSTKRSAGAFPSTSTMASLPFRLAVMARIEGLRSEVREVNQCLDKLCRTLGHRPYLASAVPALHDAGKRDPDAGKFARFDGAYLYPEDLTVSALARDEELAGDVPGGVEELVGEAHAAVQHLLEAVRPALSRPSPYLALVAQDIDRMGATFSMEVPEEQIVLPGSDEGDKAAERYHGELTRRLSTLAAASTERVHDLRGRMLYAGGDDLVVFADVPSALGIAEELRRLVVAPGHLPGKTASTAVVFFHRSYSLQSAIRRLRQALHEAKDSGRDRLAVVVLRRGGERASTVLQWGDVSDTNGRNSAALLRVLGEGFAGRLSPSVIGKLEPLMRAREIDGRRRKQLGREPRRLIVERAFDRSGATGRQAAAALRVLDLTEDAEDLDAWMGALQCSLFVARESPK
jgi:hypothetical protein